MAMTESKGAPGWLCLACCLALNCSSSDSDTATHAETSADEAPRLGPSEGGAGGSSSQAGATSQGGADEPAGGATTGAGGEDADTTAGPHADRVAACIKYVLAACNAYSMCQGANNTCLQATFNCPDLAFSEGSTRTVEKLLECAERYETASCEELRDGSLPDCVTPGTLAEGAQCSFSSQCESLACSLEGECGTCVPSAEPGGACGPEVGLCPNLYVCEAGICEPGPSYMPGTNVLGEECTGGGSCDSGLTCRSGVCAPYPTEGEACDDTRHCVGGSYCELDDLTCHAPPGEGERCGVDAFTGGAAYCGGDLRCKRSTDSEGLCELLPTSGQPCLFDAVENQLAIVSCDKTSRCDESQTPPLCVPKSERGQPCQSILDCVDGASCLCPDLSSDCIERICGEMQLGGQPCDQPGDVCHPAYICDGGTCQAVESQGLFASSCGG